MIRTLQSIVILFIFLIFHQSAFGQKQNYFSFELAGSGGIASVNYEHTIMDKTVLDLNMRYGFSFIPIDKNNGTNFIFPIMLHGLIGQKNHKLDLAIGQALSITSKGSFFLSAPLALGYRYQPAEKNYFLRASYTPLVSYLVDFQWQHWGGLTFGYHFNRNRE